MNDVLALLLTDVVDSTQLAESLGDAAAAELGAAHDRVARDLLRLWRGREIDKTDGMLMIFDSASDAVSFALAYHAALATLPVPLRARSGLHVGAVILRANPPEDVAHGAKPLEVEGIAKPVAARVMSLALGGQTLLTAEARAALGTTALRVQSHGHWRVKGIAEPVELFEAGGEHAPFMPPPDTGKVYRVVRNGELWLPLRDLRHNLPAERDSFVGRRDALDTLARRLDGGARLVSLLGIGGTGKTRLALRFAWTWLGDYPGGVWFCDLSQARDVDGIVQAVALGLDVPLGKDDPVQQLGHAIAGRGHCLLILDNFEQVARHAPDTLGRWLDRAADARFLVTTREVLGLPGEEALALPPLTLSDAQALFERRAAAAKRDYQPSADDTVAIPQLVKLLDGLPLAIELAAARVRVMSPRAMLSRMDQRFMLLAAQGGRLDRQATLRAAFDWSWDLLSDAEKSALAQLSVFEGGFTLEAAEGVLERPAIPGACDPIDLLQSLVDKSFVQRVGDSRFDLLVSVQEYAGEHLRMTGHFPGSGADAQRDALVRHGRYLARWAVIARDDREGSDLGNLCIACRRAIVRSDIEVTVATLEGAWSLVKKFGPFRLGLELAQAASQLTALGDIARARVANVLGCALNALGSTVEAQQQLQTALELAQASGHSPTEAQLLLALGDTHNNLTQHAAAKDFHRAALAVARSVGDRSLECGALNGLGSACMDLGQDTEAREHYLAALRTARASGDRFWEGSVLGNLGVLHFSEGALEEAMDQFVLALQIARELGERRVEGNMLCNLAALHQLRGRLPQALTANREALDVARAIGHVRLECVVLCNLGLVNLDLEEWDLANASFESALALARQIHDRRSEGQILGYLGQLNARRGRYDVARAHLDAGEPLLKQASDRHSLGLLACQRVELESLAGNHAAASTALIEAREIGAELGSGPDSEFGKNLSRASGLFERLPGPDG